MFGRALDIDRPTAAAIIPDDASLRPLRAVTLEAWVRPDSARGSRTILVKEGGGKVAYALSTTAAGPRPSSTPARPGTWPGRPRRWSRGLDAT